MGIPPKNRRLGRWALALFALLSVLGLINAQRQEQYLAGRDAFNAGSYTEARDKLWLLAQLGDDGAQHLMAYMSGLGLGGPVDIPDALHWMEKSLPRGTDPRSGIADRACYLGHDALKGNFGPDKVPVGRLWLEFSALSGSVKAKKLLAENDEEVTLDRLMADQSLHE